MLSITKKVVQTLALFAASPPQPPPAAVDMCWTGNDRCAGGRVNDGRVPRAHALHVPDENRLFLPGEECCSVFATEIYYIVFS